MYSCRFLSELPAGDEIAIVTYEGEATARTNLEPTVVTELNRAGIHGKIPGRVGLETVRPCLACGLDQARRLAAAAGQGRDPASVIILATSGAVDNEDNDDQLSSSADEEDESVPIYALTYSSSNRLRLGFASEVLVIDETEDSVDDVANLLTGVLRRNTYGGSSRLQFFRTRMQLAAGERSVGKFVVEDALRRDLYIVASTQHKEDVESFELTSPSGRQHKFPVVEKGVLYFTAAGLSEAGVWSFSLRIAASAMLTASSSTTTTAVVVSAYAATTTTANQISDGTDNVHEAASETAVLDVWTAGEYPALMLYARLTYGRLPVLNASVRATIGGGGNSYPLEIILEDGGTGYPDVTTSDGIYSAYVTGLAARPVGFYQLAFQADDAKGRARVRAIANGVSTKRQQPQPSSSTVVPTPAFTRFARSSLYVAQAARVFIRDGRPQAEDLQPPGRVTDLHVESSATGSLQVSLAWTAPGGDFTAGRATRYELRCYTNRAALDEDRFTATGLPVPSNLLPEPAAAGMPQTATIGLPWHNEIFYYGLVAFDASDNRSPVSNLVPVFVDEALASQSTNSSSDSSQLAGGLLKSSVMFQSGTDENIIYSVAGSLTGLALIAICLGVAFVCRSRRKELTNSSESLDYVKEFGLPGSSLLPASKYALPAAYSPPLVKSASPSDFSQDSVFLSQKEELEAASSLYTTYQNLQHHFSEQSPLPPASDSSSEGALSSADSRRYMLDSHSRPWQQEDHLLGRDGAAAGDGSTWRSESIATTVTSSLPWRDRQRLGEVEAGDEPTATWNLDSAVSNSHHRSSEHSNCQSSRSGWQQLDPVAAAHTWSERHRSSSSMRSRDAHSVDMDHVDFRDKRRRRESFV